MMSANNICSVVVVLCEPLSDYAYVFGKGRYCRCKRALALADGSVNVGMVSTHLISAPASTIRDVRTVDATLRAYAKGEGKQGEQAETQPDSR